MKLILLGPPGAGKGTQAEVLSKKFAIPTISTGAMIRTAIREKTPMGLQAEKLINDGKLVPDDVVIEIVKDRLSQEDCKNGFILDGFPRTVSQAIALKKMQIPVNRVLSLEVADDAILERLTGRRECESCGAPYHISHNPPKADGICDKCGGKLVQREDDTPETIQKRLKVYHAQTEALKQFYLDEGLLVTAKGQERVQDTVAEVMKALGVSE